MKHSRFRGLAALGTAIAVAALSVAALAAPSSAADNPLPTGNTANLHITKYDTTNGVGGHADGTQSSKPSGSNTLDGVTFTVKQVNTIDLHTQAGWDAAGTLATAYNSAAPGGNAAAESAVTGQGYTLGAATTKTTAGGGLADFLNLPVGVYLVEETAAPAGVTPTAPFLVTLPMTDPSSTSTWNYDVYVYPKNAVTTATKSVDDAGAHALGDHVAFTVNGEITPATGSDPNAPLTGYVMTDNLDPKLTYVGSTVALADGSATLTEGTDYELTTPGTNTDGTTYVEVRFTPTGLALLGQHRDTQVVWTIDTTVNASGVIQNTAYLYPDKSAVDQKDTSTNPDNPPGTTGAPGDPNTPGSVPPTPTNTVETKWGGVEVLKRNQAGVALPDATFQVYVTNSKNTKPDLSTATPLSIAGTSSWTTGSDGITTIDGLRYSAFADNNTVVDGATGYNYYWLVETKAPSGYELQAEPIGFTVESAASTDVASPDITVTDVKKNAGFALPFTGGTGGTVATLIGLAILAAAAIAATIVARRRRDEAAQR
ncbi:MAG: SpaH/EbpB family LPXTG-anchored major pilin [Actinomycetia bacterium]|nr:SpaH/EbpB family LPXTG-anchored major pilin [Actinomycetes bacterium]